MGCRELERGIPAAQRGAEAGIATLEREQAEVGSLEQQLAMAVRAAEAAKERYQRAASSLRCVMMFSPS